METEWIEDINSERDEETSERRVAATRTKYRVRLEREPNAVTNIFLTQRRAELQNITDQGGVWAMVSSDPELEAEMSISLMEHVGQSRDAARLDYANAEGSRLYLDIKEVGGVPVLLVGDVYSRVWRRTGVALDRAGLVVFDQDRNKGVYLIDVSEFRQPDDLQLSRNRYQIHLLSQGSQTLITAHNGFENDGVIAEEEAKLLLRQILSAYQVFRTSG
jgi:outer membrane protein assembly factor BamC